ncbi:hypothetical protein [Rubritalea tangerina]
MNLWREPLSSLFSEFISGHLILAFFEGNGVCCLGSDAFNAATG